MVPDGWTRLPLSEICKKQVSYGIVQTGENIRNGVPCLRVVDLTKDVMKPDEMIRTSEAINESYKKTILEKDEIVMALRGEVGLARLIPPLLEGANITRGLARISAKREMVDPKFLLWAIRAPKFRSDLTRRIGGSALQEISLTELRKVLTLVPPLPEQRKIAQILSTWDKAITNTEQLLANSQRQKKALMQQLLTGKKRLLDENGVRFSGEWEEHRLLDVASIIVSPVDKKIKEGELSVELCNYTDVYYNTRITRKLPFMRATATAKEIEKYTLKDGDVVITKDSETPGDIAIPALIAEDLLGVVCGYHLAILRPKADAVYGSYLNYLLAMPKTRYYFFTLANGATRFGLSVGSINNAQFVLPSIKEQETIASFLELIDEDIEKLKRKIKYFKAEKKALMQQLLTGKRRVSNS